MPSTSASSTSTAASSTKSAAEVLVFGYGNELRTDDGVGPRIARRLEHAAIPGIRSLALHQLTPELAEPIAAAATVIFVDASVEQAAGDLAVIPLAPPPQLGDLGHTSDPRTLLLLAHVLYGRAPAAWLVSIGVGSLDFGEHLTPEVEAAVPAVLETIGRLARLPAGRMPAAYSSQTLSPSISFVPSTRRSLALPATPPT